MLISQTFRNNIPTRNERRFPTTPIVTKVGIKNCFKTSPAEEKNIQKNSLMYRDYNGGQKPSNMPS